jgi:hypothetical protein
MLTGQKLLSTVKSIGSSASKQELCEATGYTSTSESGKTKYLWNALQSALLSATGFELPTTGSGGPRPSFTTQTLTNRNVVVGKCYAKLLGAEPGQRFGIQVNEDSRQIILTLED